MSAELDRAAIAIQWACLVLLAVTAVSQVGELPPRGSPREQPSRPPDPMAVPQFSLDPGACPTEQCGYGEEWLAKEQVELYSVPPTLTGDLLRIPAQSGRLRAGTWVTTVGGGILATRGDGRVLAETRAQSGTPPPAGNIVPIYTVYAEGCLRAWVNGSFVTLCGLEVERFPENEWWVEIRDRRGGHHWVRSPGSFVSRDGLTTELGRMIRREELHLSARLSAVDSLLALGADINGSGGPYGDPPLEAGVQSNDTTMLRELMHRGLVIRDLDRCALYPAIYSALQPEGEVMLEFLLRNGVALDCLRSPGYHAFLRFGISMPDYPVERAIRVARVLHDHGADIEHRDHDGKSIFDLLEAPEWRARVAPLHEAMRSLQRGMSVLIPGLYSDGQRCVTINSELVVSVRWCAGDPPESLRFDARIVDDSQIAWDEGRGTLWLNSSGDTVTVVVQADLSSRGGPSLLLPRQQYRLARQ